MKSLLLHAWRQAFKRRLFVVSDMTTRLQTLRRAGFVCTGVIDGGAFRGDWSREFWSVFTRIPVLMIEPQPVPQALLRALAATAPGSSVCTAVLSDHAGTVTFSLQETNSGVRVMALAQGEPMLEVPCITLDAILWAEKGFSPNLLRLDLQGHELQSLIGAR